MGVAPVHRRLQASRNPWPAERRSDGTTASSFESTTSFRAGRDRSRGQSSDRPSMRAGRRSQSLKSSGLSAIEWGGFAETATAVTAPTDPGRVGWHCPFAEGWQVVVREGESQGDGSTKRRGTTLIYSERVEGGRSGSEAKRREARSVSTKPGRATPSPNGRAPNSIEAVKAALNRIGVNASPQHRDVDYVCAVIDWFQHT